MSNPLKHETLPDDLFRNRIAAALRELDQPESDVDIAATLDAIDAEPLSDDAQRRIMRQVQRSIASSRSRETSDVAPPASARAELSRVRLRRSQFSIVALCASAFVATGLMFVRFEEVERPPLGPGELMASNDRHPGHRPIQAASSTNSEVIQRVKLGETLSTGPREKRRVTLLDGSVLSINEQSQVTVVGHRRVKLLAGEVFVEVVPGTSSERFVVETPQRTVTALGTKFVVKAQGRATNVVVTQGKVQVSGVDEVIPAGQELIADLNESTTLELRPAKRSAYVVEWVKDLMAATGSVVVPTSEHAGGSVTVVDPQGQEMKLSLRKFHVDVHLEEGFARTTIDQTYFNHTWEQLEGTFRFPLPADASLSRLAMYVNGKLMEGGMVERDYGRNVFEQIRHTRRDPALLEWVDGSTFQMRVFPLEARQEKRILLSYTQRLPNDYGKAVYRFPSGHNLEGVREWSTNLRVKGAAGTKWYSPSHLLNGRDESGDLVIDGREEYAALDRDLVVELSDEPAGASPRLNAANRGLAPAGSVGTATWSVCEQDGFRYVMLRQRPELKANAVRSQRQWIFLVENSADRNDILAETQRQIAKVLLDNAEHSDTFSIIRAGTQAESFRRKPVECSLENVAAARQFLSGVAPIGALDLERALLAVQKQARGQREVWIVHLGTGIPVLGERDETTLLRLLPSNARYVGVAVGKRWSKSFMESAANHTGGHVTQINPDETVAWRAFDLLSTLNAPRLTEIAVRSTLTRSVSEGERSQDVAPEKNWLLLTNSLAHGQELAAVARFPMGQPLPQSVTITGKLNGKPYSQTVDLPDNTISRRALAPGSNARTEPEPDASAFRLMRHVGHLPRTWARLEIDRLVALGATEHKPQIIELSRSMYVMSPFTSLLVLETEAMYEQFKVDRGRKDHWAMYPAPAEIPVVADQGPSQLSPLDAAKERLKLTQARAKTAQSNYERSVTEKRPPADLKRLERLNRAEQAEVRLIEREIQRIERANAAAADPIRIAWESVVQRRSAWQLGYLQQAARHHWNLWGRTNTWSSDGGEWSLRGDRSADPFRWQLLSEGDNGNGILDGRWTDLDLSAANQWSFHRNNAPLTSVRVLDLNSLLNLNVAGNMSGELFNANAPDFDDIAFRHPLTVNGMVSRSTMGLSSIPVTPYFSTLIDGDVWDEKRFFGLPVLESVDDYGFGEEVALRVRGAAMSDISKAFSVDGRKQPGWLQGAFFQDDDSTAPEVWYGRSKRRSRFDGRSHGGRPFLRGLTHEGLDSDRDGDGIPDAIWMNLEPTVLATESWPAPVIVSQRPGGGRRSYDTDDGFIAFENGKSVAFDTWHEIFGRYPVVDMRHPLAGVLKDLPSYAPGLQTWPADRLAIVEQAAATKTKRGEVDPEARRLIEKARSLGWESFRWRMAAPGRPAVLKSQTRTAEGGHPTVIADGSGRFVFDREVGEGLKEQVIHDGSTLWHLYPEIGLGAKRTLSRFHQSAIQSLIPWYVPSADDLSVEADVKSVGDRTIRITEKPVAELVRVRTDGDPIRILTNSATKAPHQIAVELVFAEDGRLSETRVIDLTANKRLAKQTFAADGTIRQFDFEDKLISETNYERQPSEAPNLVPATKDLVVLPLPYRSAAGVPVTVPVNLQTNAPDYAKLSDDDALTLLASYFAEARQTELATFIEQRYTAKRDHRIGLAVLMSSVMPQSPLVAGATKQHPDVPLARFLEQFASFPAQGNLNASLIAGDSASPFLKRICSAFNHYARWAADRATTNDRPAADIQIELAETLAFVRDCHSVDLATKLLATVHLGLQRAGRMNAAFARQLNDATVAIAEARDLPAFARTARIEWLLTIGEESSVAQAKELFRNQLGGDFGGSQSRQRLGGIGLDTQSLATLATTRSAFVKHFKTRDGQPCGPWSELVLEAARLDQPERASVRFENDNSNNSNLEPDASAFRLIALARSCIALSEPTLAASIFELAMKEQNLVAQPRLNLAALTYAQEAGHWELAEACVQRALADEKLQKVSQLWRDAAAIKQQLLEFSEWIECLDRAYELEFAALPKTLDLNAFRIDYGNLFNQFDQRTEQLVGAKPSEKVAFAHVVQRAAARWRDIDVDDTVACHRTAFILAKLGLPTAAWNYWTTPLAETPDRSAVWTTFASAMHSQQRFVVADRAWSTAFACEPTNPEILLQHAQFLRSTRQEQKARELLTKITTSTWQPRFENTKQQAQSLLSGGGPPK